MWVEELKDGRFKFVERYKDPLTGKSRKVSKILAKNTKQSWNHAQNLLNKKIDAKLKAEKESTATYEEMKNDWYKYYKHTIKDSSWSNMQGPINIANDRIPGKALVARIDSPMMQDIINELYYEDNYSLQYVKIIKSVYQMIFDYAISKKEIQSNPMLSVKIKRKPQTFEEKRSVINKYYEKEEIKAILKYAREEIGNERFADTVEFMALNGMRFGEVMALYESDWHGDYVRVDGTIDYSSKKQSDAVKTTPKNESAYRDVLLNERSKEILKKVISENKLLAQNRRYNDRGLIFTSFYGNPQNNSNFNKVLKRHTKRCGIKKDVSSHILRHTHISFLAEMNVPLKVVMDRVGHSDSDMTLKIYTHITDKMQKDLGEKLNQIDLS